MASSRFGSSSSILQCKPHLTPGGSGVLADVARIDEEFRKAWFPYFCRSGQRDTSLEEFNEEVEGWLPLLPDLDLPRLTGQMLADVVHRKGATAASLDGWRWRELKVLPVSTQLGQRPLSVLPVVHCIWASARMGQLEEWFQSWVPESVFSARGGRGRLRLGMPLLLILRWFLLVLPILMSIFVADVIKVF